MQLETITGMSLRWYTLGTVLAAASYSSAAMAQAQPPQPQQAENPQPQTARNNEGVQDIIVTAQRRQTKLQETPIAITALTAGEIDRKHIVDFNDVSLSVPNLTFTQITRQETFVSIRGTSVSNDTPGSDAGVSTFVDGVPRTGVHDYDPDLFDLQSVEVLRGPQGTLFGRNTTGGAILLRTAEPSSKPLFRGEVTYGSENLIDANAIVNGPLISDQLAGKIAISFHHRDAFIKNVTLGGNDGRESAVSMHAQLLWTPRSDIKAVIRGDYLRDTSESRASRLEGTFQPTLFPQLKFGPEATNEALRPRASNVILGLSATLDWNIGPGTLTSITGYRSVTPNITYSPSGDPVLETLGVQRVRDRQFSQEVRYGGKSDRLTYLVGLFYLHLNRLDDIFFTVNPFPGTVLSLAVPPGATQNQNQAVLTQSSAAFGEASYSILDSVDLTLGARYSSEKREGHTEITPDESSGPYSHRWNSFTPKATITFRPAHRALLYLTVAKGFQSGGFDGSAGTNEGLRTPFSPETVINYELGAKISGLRNRVTANVAVFRADYSNLQRTAFDSNPAVNAYRTINAGKARVQGVELEMTALPVQWLTLGLNYAYTDAKYIDFRALQDDGSYIDFSGNRLAQTPKHQLHLSAEVSTPWPAVSGSIVFGGDFTYRSNVQFTDANDTPEAILRKTRYNGILNVHAGWTSPSGKLGINFFAKNLTDKRALVSYPDFTPYFATLEEFSNPSDHIYFSRYSPKRTLGVSFLMKY